MTYIMRDRPDGQIEIIVNRPVLVGVFPERATAQRVCHFLQDDEAFGQLEEAPFGFATTALDVAEVEAEVSDAASVRVDIVTPKASKPRQAGLPAVVDEKTPTAFLPVIVPKGLTEAQIDAAFHRIAGGEKIASIAPDFGLTLNQLRGMWAGHKSKLQRHLAAGGQIACSMCQTPFVPSLSYPDTCARCSRD